MRKIPSCLMAGTLAAAQMLGLPGPAQAQGDGPRAYQLLPEGTNMLSAMYLSLQGNSTADPGKVYHGMDVDVNVAVLQFTKTIDVAGQQAGLFLVAPAGKIDAAFHFGLADRHAVSQGAGDAILGAVFGFYNSPSMPLAEYVTHRPGLAAGALVKLGLPTGTYDPDKLINLGSNRTWLQLGFPASYSLGASFVDPHLTTFEILPSVVVYGDNTDPFGPASVTGQAPLMMLEAHVTHNFNRAIWGSVDMLWEYGGETSTDGQWNGDTQRAFGMGLTGFLATGKTSGLKVSYGGTLSANAYGADGTMFRAIWMTAF